MTARRALRIALAVVDAACAFPRLVGALYRSRCAAEEMAARPPMGDGLNDDARTRFEMSVTLGTGGEG